MNKFVFKILIFTILFLFLSIFIFFFLPYNPDNYLLAYNKKCDLLRQESSGSRIILVGGSNLAFGMDSKMIEDSLHINVINYGLHAGIGLKYMIDDICTYVKENDIIVFAPEHTFFFGKGAYGEGLTLSPIIYLSNGRTFGLLDKTQKYNVIQGLFDGIIVTKIKYSISVFLHRILRKEDTPDGYSLSGFDEYGDYCKHWSFVEKKYIKLPRKLEHFNYVFGEYFVKKIKELRTQCQVVIIPPAIIEKGFHAVKDNIEEVDAFLLKNDIPFLVSPQTHMVPNDCAYDGVFHLNIKGVDIYTTCVIEELKDFLAR
jgi:hypothetical protein